MIRQKGFSLIELLIVVVVIGIIAAVAIPNLLAARRSANEGSAIGSLRSYHSAQATYQATAGNGDYAGVPFVTNAFQVLAAEQLLDSTLGGGIKSGYTLAGHAVPATSGAPACHLGQAYPVQLAGVTQTGTRHFVIATEGVVNEGTATGAAGFAGTSGVALCTVAPVAFSPLDR